MDKRQSRPIVHLPHNRLSFAATARLSLEGQPQGYRQSRKLRRPEIGHVKRQKPLSRSGNRQSSSWAMHFARLAEADTSRQSDLLLIFLGVLAALDRHNAADGAARNAHLGFAALKKHLFIVDLKNTAQQAA